VIKDLSQTTDQKDLRILMLEFYQRLFINIVEEKEDDLFFRYAAKKDDPILYKFIKPNFHLSDEEI